MLNLISSLIEELSTANVRYSHWKSNVHLADAMDEGGELDLLVRREDAYKFIAVISGLGFKRAADPLQTSYTSVNHYYQFDANSNKEVHLHVYFRVITGESLLKNYCIPIEKMLLAETFSLQGLPVVTPEAEKIVMSLRTAAKHSSLSDYLLLRSHLQGLYDEALYLSQTADEGSSTALLKKWLPNVSPTLLDSFFQSILTQKNFIVRYQRARRIRTQLKPFSRYTLWDEIQTRIGIFLKRIAWRLRKNKSSKRLDNGGIMIAFIGAEAVGKSTMVDETITWLSSIFHVQSAHLGKPPSTYLSVLPNMLLPLLRRQVPEMRTSRIEADSEAKERSILYYVRSVFVAWDRRYLATKLRRNAVNGQIVICDRYPSSTVGAMDSAKLEALENVSGNIGWLKRILSRKEKNIYRQIPPPDLVIHLTVPVDVAVERNRNRVKVDKESDDYVIRRHTSRKTPQFDSSTTVVQVDTSQTIDATKAEIRQLIWSIL